jgi:hypothetical protein
MFLHPLAYNVPLRTLQLKQSYEKLKFNGAAVVLPDSEASVSRQKLLSGFQVNISGRAATLYLWNELILFHEDSTKALFT